MTSATVGLPQKPDSPAEVRSVRLIASIISCLPEPLEAVATPTPTPANVKIKMVPRGKVVGFRCGTKNPRSPPKVRSAHQYFSVKTEGTASVSRCDRLERETCGPLSGLTQPGPDQARWSRSSSRQLLLPGNTLISFFCNKDRQRRRSPCRPIGDRHVPFSQTVHPSE